MIGSFVTARSRHLGYSVQGWIAMEYPVLIVIGQNGDRYHCDKESKYTEVDNPPVLTDAVREIINRYLEKGQEV